MGELEKLLWSFYESSLKAYDNFMDGDKDDYAPNRLVAYKKKQIKKLIFKIIDETTGEDAWTDTLDLRHRIREL